MPSSMIHLLTAYKFNPKASVAFWIGNIVPDSVSDRIEKDKTHFRDNPDRLNALKNLANMMNLSDELNQGILLHLYLDYYWDSSPMRNYIENYKEGNWFLPYRNEIALAGAWLFHHTHWGENLWDEMLVCPASIYENGYGVVNENVKDFISRNSKWHRENNIGPSSAFTPAFIEEFTSKVAIDFKTWINDIKKE